MTWARGKYLFNTVSILLASLDDKAKSTVGEPIRKADEKRRRATLGAPPC